VKEAAVRRIVFGCSLLVLATLTPIAAGAAGLALRWDNCYSDGGVVNKTFACDTNVGSERLVMSFVLDSPMADVSGSEYRLLINSATATLPAWWQFKSPGTCRQLSLAVNMAPPPGSVGCVDWSSGNAVSGIGSYNIGGVFGPNGALVSLAVAVPPNLLATLNAGQEYFAGNLVINHAKTVGTGACGGCNQPVCIVLDYINITTPTLANNRKLLDPAFSTDSNFARWQNAQETNVQVVNCDGPLFGCFHSYTCVLASTPTRGSTWGAVKSLYR
jgi:hypothetical protein